MRIAVLLKDRCQPKQCSLECIKFCPRVRVGDETIVMGEKGKPVISEPLCAGCGICVHKCPLDAIRIINLPEELDTELVHQFGKNEFRLYRLPAPKRGEVTGILGPNGIGKTTTFQILSGTLIPNLGEYEKEGKWTPVLERYAGTELYNYLHSVSKGEIRTALKPQYVDKLADTYSGEVRALLEQIDESRKLDEISKELELNETLEHDISELSGGELQRLAIAATMLKDADIYFFDEPSSYLDIYQRLKIARIIRELAETKQVIIIEHDLAVLDFLADTIYLMYGSEGAYGVMAQPRGVRSAVNTYLSGFMREENIRFRDRAITFEPRPPRADWQAFTLLDFPPLKKEFKSFTMDTEEGTIKHGEVIGIVGPNATGKTTFVKMLAGEIDSDEGELDLKVKVSYKPQYIKPDYGGTVAELFYTTIGEDFDSPFFENEVAHPLNLKPLFNKHLDTLSGGELQRVAIALCLTKEADLYLIDEPSAYLDSNQRMNAAKTIRRVMEKIAKSAMIVDHDVYFIDLVSDSIMTFSGISSKEGHGAGPFGMRKGMNRFLKDVGITFRRDNDTHRPRINKPESRLDREQKGQGEYYYSL